MRFAVFALLGVFLVMVMHVCAAQISGPESVFVTEPRELSYEIVNNSLEDKHIELRIYCPKEILCELSNVPAKLEAKQTARFLVSFEPYPDAVSKRYIVTILGRLGNEPIKKEIEVIASALSEPEEGLAVEEPQYQSPINYVHPMAPLLTDGQAVMNILLAIIALILFLLLIIKIKEFRG